MHAAEHTSSNPNKPVVGGSIGRYFSLVDILQEVRLETPCGRRYHESLKKLQDEESGTVDAD